jgi:hypothetical protein
MRNKKWYEENKLIHPAGFNLRHIPGREYRKFNPIFTEEKRKLSLILDADMVVYEHMVFVRSNAYDVEGEEYVFIRPYSVGHTVEGNLIFVVVDTQTKGGCHFINDSGKIAGDGFGKWDGVLCPADAEATLVADLDAEEKKRRREIPPMLFSVDTDTSIDTSELS